MKHQPTSPPKASFLNRMLFCLLLLGLLPIANTSDAYTANRIKFAQVQQQEDLRPFKNCNMGSANPNLLWCDHEGYRQAMDMSLCVPGSLRAASPNKATVNRVMVCDAQNISGSFARSCDRMLVASHLRTSVRSPSTKTGSVVYVSYCEGPKIKPRSVDGRKVLKANGQMEIEYNARIGKRRYRNQLPAHSCPTRRFWNDLGQLRCAK